MIRLLILALLLCGCATEAMRQSWEQITADIEAQEYQDALLVSKTATEKYGKAQMLISAQTTANTVWNIKNDRTWQDYVTDFWTIIQSPEALTGVSVLLAVLLIYLKRKTGILTNEQGILTNENKDMIQAINEKGSEALKMDVAERQAKRLPLHKRVKEIEKGEGR